MLSLSQIALGVAQVAFFSFKPASAGHHQICGHEYPLSYHNTIAIANTCYFNAPGGSLLQTQLWDTNPATGPANSWRIHGLWPDHCDGPMTATATPPTNTPTSLPSCSPSRRKNSSNTCQSIGKTMRVMTKASGSTSGINTGLASVLCIQNAITATPRRRKSWRIPEDGGFVQELG